MPPSVQDFYWTLVLILAFQAIQRTSVKGERQIVWSCPTEREQRFKGDVGDEWRALY